VLRLFNPRRLLKEVSRQVAYLPSEATVHRTVKVTALVAFVVMEEVCIGCRCGCLMVERREVLQLASFEIVSRIALIMSRG
jgi:hypothetical protein